MPTISIPILTDGEFVETEVEVWWYGDAPVLSPESVIDDRARVAELLENGDEPT